MNKQYINIAIAGLSIHDSDELKHQLSNILPHNFSIQWKTASDINLDCLFIHEHFFDTEGIQRILNSKHFPWLKIAKDNDLSGKVENDTLYLPLSNTSDLNRWVDTHIINNDPIPATSFADAPTQRLPYDHPYSDSFFKKMLNGEGQSKVHLYDQHGTLGVIDINKNIVWTNLERLNPTTNFSFDYDLASTMDLLKVSRKESEILQDWLWNMFWLSPDFYQIAPEDGHYKIKFWPKPMDKRNRKKIFQLSAYFIQGAKISKIVEQHNIPLQMVRQFIAANLASGNIEKINAWDKHYTPPERIEKTEEQGFIKNFIGKIRLKFGF